MKNPLPPVRALSGILMLFAALLFGKPAHSQQSLIQVNTWNAYVHLPWDYNSNNNTYPTIIFFPGIGEVGTNANLVISNGPGAYISQGWNGNVLVGSDSVKFIVISLQPPSAYPVEAAINTRIQTLKSLYRIDNSRLYLTGLSHGGWCSSTFVTGDALGGPYTYASQVAAVVNVEGVKPDDNSPYPDLFDNFALSGGKYLGFEQALDFRDIQNVVNRMNATVPNSATYIQTNFGGGGHCCWSQFYGGGGVQPTNFTINGISQNIYQWMARQQLGGASTPANIAPTANAGTDQSITLPTSSVTLNGSGNDADGTIASYQWTKASGPAAGTIVSINAASTIVTALTAGTYQFVLTVTDNNGATGRDTVQVTVTSLVNLAPVVNAGSDINIQLPTNSTTLSGTANDPDGTIASYLWSQISGPSTALISNATASSSSVLNLLQGQYKFEFKATDNSGASSRDTVIVNVAAASNATGGCGCDRTLTAASDGGIYFTNSGTNKVLPGQKLCIASGTYKYISLSGLVGEAGRPITITNCGGQVISNGVNGYGMRVVKSQYFRFTGTGDPNYVYGFKTNGIAPSTPSGISIMDSTSDYEIDHLELTQVGVGVFTSKPPADADSGTWRQGWVNKNLFYHDLFIHNTGGEAMYLGATSSSYDVLDYNGQTITVEPILQDNVHIYNNIIDSAGWDGIQLASSPNSSIHHNVVKNYGMKNLPVQQAGIIFGGKCSGSVYNNYIQNGTGNGMQIFGNGTIKCYNNIVVDAGWDGTSVRQDAIIVDDRPFPNNIYSGLQIYLLNNTVVNSGNHTVRVYNTYGTMATGNKIINNLLVQPNGTSPYDDRYIVTATGLNVTIANNIRRLNISEANFVNPAYNDYRLQINSPAVDSGQNISSLGILSDYAGTARPKMITYDAGAYEYDDGNPPANQPPTANAGADQVITVPANTVSLNGNGTDSDGSIVSYQWNKISGPIPGSIASPGAQNTSANGLIQGTYQFELIVTDNNGATDRDTMQVKVNLPPVANAGADQTITLPVNLVTLNGISSDADGSVVATQWTQYSGPSIASITTATAATTTVTGLTQGVYYFIFRVTDNNSASGRDTVKVTVNPAPNQAPTANAGADQTITLPTNSVTLNGSGTDADGTIASYNWTKISGPAAGTITNPASASTTVTGLVQGTYQFTLTVTDNSGASAKDTMKVTVNPAPNQAPTANAGADQTITLPTNTATLNGSGTDADGTIASYNWTKISGPAAGTITNPASASTTVTGLVQGTYQFTLTVTDNSGASAKDTMKVTVNPAPNQAPTANAGADQTITLPTNTVTLNGSGTDADGTIASYNWTKISGPAAGTITNPASASTTVTGLVQGTYQFTLTVTDNSGASAKDTMKVTVNPAPNQAPTANAGADQTITLPTNSVTLNGSGTDADGTIASYNWTKISGPAAGTITNPASASTTVTGLVQGTYQFTLTVTDNSGASAKDTMKVTVNPAPNQAPTANAGADQTITLPTNSVTLNGSGTDADGTIASYNWTKISGPAAGTITNPASASTSVTGLVQGTYQFTLTVTDNSGASAKDTMKVTVNPAPNQAPTANAGADQTITLPTNSVTLNGSGTDADGTIASYNWTKISGPAAGTITNPASASTTVTGLVQGTYQFTLTVTDNSGASAKDTMKVTVNPAPNQPPTANAGADQTITLPTNTVTLNGSGTDADGTIVSYSWIKILGPVAGSITNAASAITTVTGLAQGVYQFELTVTDNNGATDKDTVKITVNPTPNQAPTANAGVDQTITLPTNSVTLNGSGTDADGTIASYNWTKISGPAAGTITNPASASTTVTGLVQGVYQFTLTVTDNNGATGRDTMKVTVNAAAPPPNQAPTANAGADQTITLPTNSVTLNGSGTDADGTIASYNWNQIAGPAASTITNPASASTTVTGLIQGTYQFALTVTDNNGATGRDTIKVTVNAAAPPPNQAPTANAGADQTITLPTNSVTLNGSGTDVDGTIASYSWTQITGPAASTITNPASASTSVTGLVQGVYQFVLIVTDNNGATGRDTMKVTVNAAPPPPPNMAPVANAGTDQEITLPVNLTTLNGTGTDADGTIVSYEWRKLSGPAAGFIVSAVTSTTLINGLSLPGTYEFELTVTDNRGAKGKDTVAITVKTERTAEKDAVRIYPNPVISTCTAEVSIVHHDNRKVIISISNSLGMVVYQKEFAATQYVNLNQIDMSRMEKGMYIITVKFDSGKTFSEKILKM